MRNARNELMRAHFNEINGALNRQKSIRFIEFPKAVAKYREVCLIIKLCQIGLPFDTLTSQRMVNADGEVASLVVNAEDGGLHPTLAVDADPRHHRLPIRSKWARPNSLRTQFRFPEAFWVHAILSLSKPVVPRLIDCRRISLLYDTTK
jgi:hypothetical protein